MMKTYGLVQLLCLSLIAVINGQSSEIYTCTRDVNIASSLQQTTLIASFKTIDRLLCLGACNRDPNCFSCSYNKDSATTNENECYLYNQVFTSSDYSYANNVDWYSKKGSTISSAPTTTTSTTTTATTSTTSTTTTTATTSTTSKITTQSNAISFGCNCSLMFYFTNTTLTSSITSYNNGTTLGLLMSTEMAILNNAPVYFLADNINNAIVKMSESWQFITKGTTITNPRVIKWANDHLYVSSNNGFNKMDYNFNISKSIVDTGATYNGIYHNASDNTLAVAVFSRNRVDWLDADLIVLANITLGTYSPMGVSAYDDSLYVSALVVITSTVIYEIRNRVIINTLPLSTTTAMYIYSIVFDDFGYMALTFRDQNTVRLYHINGTSTGFNITFPNQAFYINFDFDKRMMISTRYDLYFYN